MKTETTSPNKSQLAKLLATENINITIDATMKTAAFDLKSRTMYLPNWEGVSSDVTDLLVGHETGHALFTSEEGWHGALASKGMKFKGFLNVCEDARIEKKQKRKYPGLRKSFLKGYKELFEMDFFGVKDSVLSELLLIDRINLKCKLGSLLNVPFTAEEKLLLAEVEGTETWEQVEAVAEKLFNYCKEEQEEKKKEKEAKRKEEDTEDSFEFENEESDESEESEEEDNYSDSNEEDEEEEFENSNTETESSYGDDEEEEMEEPESLTDKAFRKNEQSLAATQGFQTVEFPKVGNLDKIVVSSSKIREMMAKMNVEAYTEGTAGNLKMKESVRTFLARNKNAIDLYVKEFQMRKSAAAWKKARQSDTGDINPGKLAYYSLTDQVFKSRTIVPNGKNHGMMLLLDWSSSMAENFENSMEQVLILATVCKRISIPFEVLAFTNREIFTRWDDRNSYDQAGFSKEVKQIAVENVYLLQLLSSNMNASQYAKAFEVCLALGRSNTMTRRYYQGYSTRQIVPHALSLGSTPLKPALLVVQKMLPEFQKKNRVDIMNLVIVTDGGCTSSFDSYYELNEDGVLKPKYIETNCKLKYKNQYLSYRPSTIQQQILSLIQSEMNVNIFGFFLLPPRLTGRDYVSIWDLAKDPNGMAVSLDVLKQQLKEKKFFESYSKGYTRFFLIKNTEDHEVVLEKDASLAKIKSAFKKNVGDRKANRILASKFMELAA